MKHPRGSPSDRLCMRRALFHTLVLVTLTSCAEQPIDGARSPAASQAQVEQPASPCTGIDPSEVVRLTPDSAAAPYRRCGTLGPERSWDSQLSANHHYLAALSNTGMVHLIDTRSWTEIAQLASPYGAITGLAFAPDSRLLATLSNPAGVLTLWNTRDGTVARSFEWSDRSGGGTLAFSKDGTRIATSMATVVDLTTGAITDWNRPDKLLWPGESSSNLLGYDYLRFVDEDRQLLLQFTYRTGSSNLSRGLYLLNPDTAAFTQLRIGWGWVRSNRDFAVSPDGDLVVVNRDYSGIASLFEAASGKRLFEGSVPGQLAFFSADSTKFYTFDERELRTHDARDFSVLSRVPWSQQDRLLGLSPTGKLVSATSAGTEWRDPTTGQKERSIASSHMSVAWSDDGMLGAASSTDSLLTVWRESDGQELCRMPPAPADEPSMASVITPTTDVKAINPPVGSSYVVSTSADGAIAATLSYSQGGSFLTIVDRRTNQVLRRFGMQRGRSELSAVVSPDAGKVYTYERGTAGYPYIAIWCR